MTDLTDLLVDSNPTSDDAIPAELGAPELANLLGISAGRVRTLAGNGVLVRTGRGRYDTRASLRNYFDRLRENAERAGRPVDADLKEANLRNKIAQAELTEAKAAAARGELVPASEVAREWASILRDLRNALLAVPSRCGASLPHLTAQDVAALEAEIRSALEGVANAD